MILISTGDPEKLRAAGVEPKVDLPGVGLNFQYVCGYIRRCNL